MVSIKGWDESEVYRIWGKCTVFSVGGDAITIPYEIRQRVGFVYNDILSFTESDDGCAVIVKREKICDHCKRAQPVKENGEVTLFDFLNGLSQEQQRAALVHLSMK